MTMNLKVSKLQSNFYVIFSYRKNNTNISLPIFLLSNLYIQIKLCMSKKSICSIQFIVQSTNCCKKPVSHICEVFLIMHLIYFSISMKYHIVLITVNL
jgi:hypothetical protein